MSDIQMKGNMLRLTANVWVDPGEVAAVMSRRVEGQNTVVILKSGQTIDCGRGAISADRVVTMLEQCWDAS